jgi:glycosyl transferase family 25
VAAVTQIDVVVISLRTSVERRRGMVETLSRFASPDWRFFDGLGADAPVQGLVNSPEAQMRRFGRLLSRAEIGCYKSHYSVIRHHALPGGPYWMLVLEDDVWIDSDFDLDSITDYADRNGIEYVRLFAKMYKPADIVKVIDGFRQIIRFRTDPYGAQAYLIGKEGAKRFVDGLDRIAMPIDDELGRFWRHGLDAYCVFPFPVVERSVPSGISVSRDESSSSRKTFNPARSLNRLSEKLRKTLHNIAYRARRAGLRPAPRGRSPAPSLLPLRNGPAPGNGNRSRCR